MNILPSSAKYLQTLGKILYEPIQRGESAFVRWAPGHGKTALISTLFDTSLILKEHLGVFQKRYLFVRIDGYLFSSGPMSELFHSMHDALREICITNKIYSKPKPSSQLTSIIITVKTIISLCQKSIQKGYELIFLIDAIDEFSKENAQELFRGLEYIVESNRERIHTHIHVNKKDIIDTCVSQSGLIQNIISIPLPDTQECLYFLHFFANKWNLKLSDDQINTIFEACGNDPVLLKESLRIIGTNKEPVNLLTQPTLLLKAKINYAQYSIAEKDVIETKLKTNYILPNQKKSAHELVFLHFWDKTYNIPLLFR